MAVSKVLPEALSFLPQGYLFGLTMSTPGSSANLTVQPGIACDSTGSRMMKLVAALTKTTGAWAAGSAVGGLDTGAIANNTWYHFFQIERPDTGAVDVCFSTSVNGPTLGVNIPAAFTSSRRIGAMKTNASSQWTLFFQLGDEFLWDVPVQDIANVTAGTVLVPFALPSIPLGIRVNALLNIGGIAQAGGDGRILIVPGDVTGVNSPASYSGGAYPTANNQSWSKVILRTNTIQQVKACGVVGTAAIYMGVEGWIDTRGRLY